MVPRVPTCGSKSMHCYSSLSPWESCNPGTRSSCNDRVPPGLASEGARVWVSLTSSPAQECSVQVLLPPLLPGGDLTNELWTWRISKMVTGKWQKWAKRNVCVCVWFWCIWCLYCASCTVYYPNQFSSYLETGKTNIELRNYTYKTAQTVHTSTKLTTSIYCNYNSWHSSQHCIDCILSSIITITYVNILIYWFYWVCNLIYFCNFNKVDRLPEDDADASKHVGVVMVYKILLMYIYIYICVCVCCVLWISWSG